MYGIGITKAFTHGGVFHADDVFSAALLKILNPNIQISRGSVVPENFDGIVFDIGKGEFDHHQEDKECRENGIPYAAFGLLWRKFGTYILNKEDAKIFDEEFIQPIDLSDNTGKYSELAQIISDFNLSWEEEGNSDERFQEAINFAQLILNNRFKQILSKRRAMEEVKKFVDNQDGKILVLDRFYPWKNVVCCSDKMFVIFPSTRGGYMVQAVPQNEDTIELKKAFPEEWRGKDQEWLKKMTGIDTFLFCHMSGFICAAETLGDAKKIAELACDR